MVVLGQYKKSLENNKASRELLHSGESTISPGTQRVILVCSTSGVVEERMGLMGWSERVWDIVGLSKCCDWVPRSL